MNEKKENLKRKKNKRKKEAAKVNYSRDMQLEGKRIFHIIDFYSGSRRLSQ